MDICNCRQANPVIPTQSNHSNPPQSNPTPLVHNLVPDTAVLLCTGADVSVVTEYPFLADSYYWEVLGGRDKHGDSIMRGRKIIPSSSAVIVN